VLVAGAGITGLAAAYQVQKARPDVELVVVEPRARLGGNIETETRDGFLLDGGPDSFLRTKPEGAELCRELGLGDELMPTLPRAHKVFVGQNGKLVPLPAGMALAVPTRIGPLVKTPLISWAAKLRVLGDLFTPPRARTAEPAHALDGTVGEAVDATPDHASHALHASGSDETVAAFLSRHFGREVTYQLAGPLLGGIFAGDIEELSIQSTFPQLVELERQQGSLIRALFAAERLRVAKAQGKPAPKPGDPFDPEELWSLWRWLRREPKSVEGPFLSLRGGMGTLVSALAQRLPEGCLRLGTRVESLSRLEDGRWSVQLDSGAHELVDRVLLCIPAHAAARVLAPSPSAQLLDAVPYVSTATVFFALASEPRACPLDGTGFIVPRSEGRLLAATWVSSKWGYRAPDGKALIRGFLGGAREPELVEQASDEELLSIARGEFERFMGPLDSVLFGRVFRWRRSNPQPVVGHAARLGRLARELRALPGLHLAGSAYDGVGIPDCIRQGRAAAAAALVGL
jgi:oxygen-dependent protoporphyrinogen oxidase